MRSHEFILKETQLDELISIRPQLKKKITSDVYDFIAPGHQSSDDWHKILTGHGFSQLGNGLYATVWEHPKFPYVLKIFRSHDEAYKHWVKFCMDHNDNPHFPKFVSTKVWPITRNVSAVRMEKLTKFNNEDYPDFVKSIYNLDISQIIVNDKWEVVDQLGYQKPPSWDEYCAAHPLWIPALKMTDEFIKRYRYRKDMHKGNFMMRGNDIVITDPVTTQ